MNIRSPEYLADPYAAFRRLRESAPVCRIEPHGHWAVARYADVLAILRNHRLFASSGIGHEPAPGDPEFLAHTRALIGTDPPDHTRLRGLVSRAFTPARIAALESRIRHVTCELLTEMRANAEFDFVADFSAPLPIIVISELLGIDAGRRRDFKRWTETLLTWRATGHDVAREAGEMFAYFTEVIAERRRAPNDDLVSALVLACDADEKLTPSEILSFVRLLLVAGTETTTNLLGNAIIALTDHPAQWDLARADRGLVPLLIEECLRYAGPVLSLARRATEDTEIAGVPIAAGELVLPLLASANHDESKFPEPRRFDVRRDPKGHVAFAEGVHYCMGAPLARLQVKIALEEILSAVGRFERAGREIAYIDSFFFRGPKALVLTESSIRGTKTPSKIRAEIAV